MEFYIVGSALTKKEPRDVDLYGVMDDWLFENLFSMDIANFQDWRRRAHNAPPNTYIPKPFISWKNHVLGAIRVLQYVFPDLVPLDFKIIPRSLLQEPNKKIDITTKPETWGIGLPNLEAHG